MLKFKSKKIITLFVFSISIIAIVFLTSSCLDENGDITYKIRVDAQNFLLEDTIDYSNIEDLQKQPLRVIKKAVEGEWQIIVYGGGTGGHSYYKNTFANITKDSIIITDGDSKKYPALELPSSTSYRWEIRVIGSKYPISKYVMIFDEECKTNTPPYHGWQFDFIQNDTLCGGIYREDGGTGPYSYFIFVKIKDAEVTK